MHTSRLTRRIKLLILAVLAVSFLSSTSSAAEYYVDTNKGNDGNPGTFSQPWKTIVKANLALKAADTVYIREGIYRESIKPTNTGKAGSPITYARYDGETVTVSVSGYGANLTGCSYITIDGIRFSSCSTAIWTSNSTVRDGIVIRNCYFSGSTSWSQVKIDGVDYSQILDNTFADRTNVRGDHLYIRNSFYGLVDGNSFGRTPHSALSPRGEYGRGCSYWVIRNNFIQNPWHTNVDVFGEGGPGTHYILFENNSVYDAGQEVTINPWESKSRYDNAGIQLMGSHNIIRKNYFTNNGKNDIPYYSGYGIDTESVRVYNNTFYEDYQTLHGISTNDTIVKNNIMSNGQSYNINFNNNNNHFVNNCFYDGPLIFAAANRILATLQSIYTTWWYGNIQENPLFTDRSRRDFSLQDDSPCINAGAWLTTVTSPTGSGTSFAVADALYFTDGWGVISGDKIQLKGQSDPVTIVSISGNTITVDQNITWKQGDGVSLPFTGSAPDIGAYEYSSGSSPPLQPASPLNLRVFVSN